MAYDQNSIPKDLRPINVARINSEEARISSPARTTEGFYVNPSRSDITSPPSVPMYLVPATSDGKIVGLSSGNPNSVIVQAPSVPVQGVLMPLPVGTPVASRSPPSISPSGCTQSPSFAVRTCNSNDQVTADGGEDSVSGKKVKLLCSFGGKILPRPSDGMLRYVGGQTRIITVRRDVSFSELVQKMVDACGQPVVMKYQLPDEDLDALVSVSCSDDLENMMEEYEKLLERSLDGSVKLRVFLFSASELDSSGMMQFGDLQDSSQKYVDAVNGVMEAVGVGIARKESIASATSTQNSDLSVADANDHSLLGQDITGPPSTNALSLRSDSTVTTDVALRSGCMDPNLANLSEAAAAPLVSGPSQILPSQPETLLERTIPLPLQQPTLGYDLQRTAIKVTTTPTPYLQGLMDAPQDTISNIECQKVPSHLIYTNAPQVVTAPRPLLLQPQYHDNVTTVVPQRFIPAVHMTMAPPSSNMSVNPTMFPTLMQSQRQVPGGVARYGWNQVLSTQEHAPLSMPYQQVTIPESIQRKDDCTVCQKQLPHAHSDTVAQEQGSIAIPDVNTIYHSLRLDDIARLHPVNKVVAPSHAEVIGVTKNLKAQREGQRIAVDHLRILGPQGVMGLSGEVQTTYCVATSHTVQSRSDDAAQSLASPIPCGRQEVLANKPVKCENVVVGVPLETTETLSHEAAKDNPEILCCTKKSRSPTDQPRKDDIFYQQSQQVASNDQLVNNAKSTPAVIPESNEVHAMVSPNDLERVFANKTDQSSMAASNLSGNTQESANCLFSNEDPWNFLQDSHLPPPMPSKIVTRKELSAPRDPFLDNSSSKDSESIQEQILDPVIHSNMNDNSEQVLYNKASPDFIKQELQAITRDNTTSVLQPSLTCAEISVSDANHEREIKNNIDAVIQAKLEDMNVKPEKVNFAFPRSDGLGRLQIIKNSDLEELRELGSSTFGTVYHGKWRGTDVAIKRINNRCFAGKPSEQDRMIDDFWNEAIKLAALHHPNVVAFYGVVLDGPGGSVDTVTEFMVNGSLRTALQKNERTLNKRKRLLIAMDVAFGMEYLHSRNIVHFDLKSDNLLVNLRDTHRPICKVGDLGLSKVKCQTLISGGERGTLPWMAPELLNGSSSLVSEKVDVFSFGIVMWELLIGEEPYGDLHYGAIIGGIVSNTLRPAVPDNCDPDWRLLMEKCWSAEPQERPSFTEITDELRSVAAKIPPKGQTVASPRTNVHVV